MGARLSYPEVDQSGRVAVVTGGNTGIGYETAKGLAVLGAHVVIACRSEERAKNAITRMTEEVSREHPDKSISVEFMPLDLASLQSVKRFTEDYKQKGLPLHLLINNAGIAAVPFGRTEDGYEMHFQVNHLGHFLLTLELLPLIKSSIPDARVVLLSSAGHKQASTFDPTNLQGERDYGRMKQYCNSKLFNILMGAALHRRMANNGVVASAVHPGFVDSGLPRGWADMTAIAAMVSLLSFLGFSRTCVKGAATTLNAAVNPELHREEFVYYSDCQPAHTSAAARIQSHQEQLWEISCNLLKDYLSPDIWREYGPKEKEQPEGKATVKVKEVQELGGGDLTTNGTAEELQELSKETREVKIEVTVEMAAQSTSATTASPLEPLKET